MQLFTHLLSSYLQGMGDFFSALPRGGSSFSLCLRRFVGSLSSWVRLEWNSWLVRCPCVRRWGNWFMVEMSASSSNSVGVAFPQPRVAGEARYPGYIYNKV